MATGIVTKSLAMLEDMEVGINKTTQMRNNAPVTGNRIFIPVAVDSDLALASIDVITYTYAVKVLGNQLQYYKYNPDAISTDEGIQSLTGPGKWIYVNIGTLSRDKDKISLLQGRVGESVSDYTTRGIGVILSEPITGTGVATANFNRIIIEDDRFNAVDDDFAPTKVDGLYIQHKFGGPGAKGGRHAAEIALSQSGITESNNTDRNYVGLAATCTTASGDGGVSGANKGAYFGMNPVVAHLGGTHIANISSMECNTTTTYVDGNEIVYHSGIQIVSRHNARGSIVDALIVGSLKSTSTVKFKTGIDFGNMNGTYPLGTDSTFANIKADTTIRSGLLLPECTDYIVKSGNVELTTNKLELGSTTTVGSTYLDFHSSGTVNDYDSRIVAVGGSATFGSGALQLMAGEVVPGCNVRPLADNVYTMGAASRRWSVVYAGTGTINTSDSTYKPIQEAITDTLLDAWADVNWMQFKFSDAIELKGVDGARWHFGLIAQKVESVFASHGIDGFSLGLLCYDKWDASEAVYDAETNELITPAIEAGSKYGIRYEEALVLEAALQRRTAKQFEARLAKLEGLLNGN